MSTTRTPKYYCFRFKIWIFIPIHIFWVENLHSVVVIIDHRSWLLKNIKQNLHLSDKVKEVIINLIFYTIGKSILWNENLIELIRTFTFFYFLKLYLLSYSWFIIKQRFLGLPKVLLQQKERNFLMASDRL